MEALGADWDGWTAHDDTYVVDGEHVVVLARYTAQHRVTGKPLAVRVAHHFVVRAGRIVRFEQFVDTALVRDAATADGRDQGVENGDFSMKRLVGTVSMVSVAPKADVLAIILVIRSSRSASSTAPKKACRSVVAASGNSSSTIPSMTGAPG